MGAQVSREDIHNYYKLGKVLGKGSYATVKEGQRKKDNKLFAVKIIKKTNLDPQELAAVHSEVDIMYKIDHPNVVKLYEIFETEEKLYLVLDLLTGGELFNRILSQGQLSEQQAAKIIREVASALKYLHSVGVVHRDLKPENLLYSTDAPDAPIKITDFGLAKLVTVKKGGSAVMKTQCGTPTYVAPEILKGKGYTSQVDMWSVGVILYTLLCGFPPFYSENHSELYDQIKKAAYTFQSPWWDNISPEAKHLVCKLLEVDASHRLTAAEVLEHPWVRDHHLASQQDLGDGHRRALTVHQARLKLRKAVGLVLAINKLNRIVHEESQAPGKLLKGEWTCGDCTFINRPEYLQCGVCGAVRQK